MLGWITRPFRPPVFQNEDEKTITASLINTISLAVILTQSVALVMPVYNGAILRREVLSASALVIAFLAVVLARWGLVKTASWLLVTAGWALITVAAFTGGGLHAPANFVYIVPVMCALLLLGFRASAVLAAATIAAESAMFILSEKGLLTSNPVAIRNSVLFASEVMFLVLITAILHMATRSTRESLRRARLEIAERIKAQDALSRSERLLSNIVNNSSAAIFAKLPDGRYLMVNKHLEELVGLPGEKIVGKTDCEIFPAETAEAFRRNDLEAIRTRGTIESEEVIQRPDGPHTYISLKVPLVDGSGNVYATCGIAADISERKRAEAAIRSSEERFAKVFNSSPVPMAIARDGRFVDVNDSFLESSGYSRDEVIGRNGDDLNMYDDPETGFKLMSLVVEQGAARNFEMNLRMKDGRIRTNLVSVEQIELGGEASLLMAGIDISERKLAEDALRTTEAKFREFFEDSLTGDYISTPDGKLLACNPAFALIFGFQSIEEALNHDVRTLYPEPAERERMLSLVRKDGRVERYESELRRRDGTPLYIVENAIGSFNEAGELVQIKGYTFDITERKKLEEQLLETRKIEAIGRLAGGIAHDFNNLLSVILAHSDLLALRTQDRPEPVRKDIELINQAAQRASLLTRQLLAFSRQQVLDVRVIDLNSVVSGSLEVLCSLVGEKIEFLTELDPEPVTVRADATQLEQVIMNLVVNARDAMPEGGRLNLRTAKVSVDERLARLLVDARPGSYAMLEVTDTGIGMDERTKARIFEPFFTTKEKGKGTGLGLATVHGIVKQCGGHINVESNTQEGTRFQIFFPANETSGQRVQSDEHRISVPSGGGAETGARDATGEMRDAGGSMLPRRGRMLGRSTNRLGSGPAIVSGGDSHLLLAQVLMPRNSGDHKGTA